MNYDCMKSLVDTLRSETRPDKDRIVSLLACEKKDVTDYLYQTAYSVKETCLGRRVYFRGLIEFSNICSRNCLYCGIRKDNGNCRRYIMPIPEIIEVVRMADTFRYGSVVLQSGERNDQNFIDDVSRMLEQIREATQNRIRVTLSCGEQTLETYHQWFSRGAHRYLLRIETSSEDLYAKIHPEDAHYSFRNRLQCLLDLKKLNYQVGSGMMVGLPFQTLEDIADDILFLKDLDVDMIGLGPYLEHDHTPLVDLGIARNTWPVSIRFERTLKTIAILRIIMKDINIAASTALQAVVPDGREQALGVGANVLMPNLTPMTYRADYQLYNNKPCINEQPDQCRSCLESRVQINGEEIAFDEWGDSLHWKNKQKKG